MIEVGDWDGEQVNVAIRGSFEEVYGKMRVKAKCIVTSPPYSTQGKRLPTVLGDADRRERTIDHAYDVCEDDFTDEVYRGWLKRCLNSCDGVVFWNVPRKLVRVTEGKEFGEIIWKKQGGSIPFARRGVIYAHEYILLFGNEHALKKPVRSIWEMVPQRKSKHPAPFPIDLPAKAIEHATEVGDLVFDPFGGSGTTAAVAKAMGRKWLTCDVSAQYVGWIDERLKKTTTI